MLAQMQINSTSTWSQGGRGAGGGTRREAGNSDFVRRALLPVMPDREEFGFTVRLNADTLALDGSAAAASVCRCKAARHQGAILSPGSDHAAWVRCSQEPRAAHGHLKIAKMGSVPALSHSCCCLQRSAGPGRRGDPNLWLGCSRLRRSNAAIRQHDAGCDCVRCQRWSAAEDLGRAGMLRCYGGACNCRFRLTPCGCSCWPNSAISQ